MKTNVVICLGLCTVLLACRERSSCFRVLNAGGRPLAKTQVRVSSRPHPAVSLITNTQGVAFSKALMPGDSIEVKAQGYARQCVASDPRDRYLFILVPEPGCVTDRDQ